MKTPIGLLLLLSIAVVTSAQITTPPSGDNQKSSVTQMIGLVSTTITYSSPDVHGSNGEDRKGHIWGELVHYGFVDQGFGPSKSAPWRAGANENTTIKFSHDVLIEGKPLKAGTYGLFLALSKEGPSQWIFSRNSSSWGSYFYSESEDALRVNAALEDWPYTEWLTYNFDDRQSKSAHAYLAWENKRIGFKVEVPNVLELYVDKIRGELNGTETGFDYKNFAAAARFCAQNKVALDQGLQWADLAISMPYVGQKTFETLSSKAMVLNVMNKATDADAIMAEAVRLPGVSVQEVHDYGRSLLAAKRTDKALEIFQLNKKLHPDDKFTTYVGLARAYTVIDDKKNAIKNWESAIKNIPSDQKSNLAYYEGELKKLKG
ncbi:DUF2911 domain-containing protein [Chryseolinea sp. T2]|uniref:DUF2911 domain-containing protein n=1 Tax=Chryseolinea sp. T2 TaxID=3129255 RepID=UPI0030775764